MRLDGAVAQLHVCHGTRVLGGGKLDAKRGPGHLAHERAGHAADALGAHELAGGRAVVDRGVAQAPQHPGVKVALDDGVHLAVRVIEVLGRVDERVLLGVDERVRHAVERVVRQHAERERPPDAGVCLGQVAHAVSQCRERARHAPVVHLVGKAAGVLPALGRREDAEEERVWALVAKEKRQELLLARDEPLRQQRGGALPEQVMGDECGHVRPFI